MKNLFYHIKSKIFTSADKLRSSKPVLPSPFPAAPPPVRLQNLMIYFSLFLSLPYLSEFLLSLVWAFALIIKTTFVCISFTVFIVVSLYFFSLHPRRQLPYSSCKHRPSLKG